MYWYPNRTKRTETPLRPRPSGAQLRNRGESSFRSAVRLLQPTTPGTSGSGRTPVNAVRTRTFQPYTRTALLVESSTPCMSLDEDNSGCRMVATCVELNVVEPRTDDPAKVVLAIPGHTI